LADRVSAARSFLGYARAVLAGEHAGGTARQGDDVCALIVGCEDDMHAFRL